MPGRRPPRDPRASRRTGDRAEALVERHLVANGWFPLARNHVCPAGEVDLVMAKGGVVAFVEVRERRRGALVDALASVTPAKQRRVVRAAQDWLVRASAGIAYESLRFDVVAVTPGPRGAPPQLVHVENAFDADAGASGR